MFLENNTLRHIVLAVTILCSSATSISALDPVTMSFLGWFAMDVSKVMVANLVTQLGHKFLNRCKFTHFHSESISEMEELSKERRCGLLEDENSVDLKPVSK